jgi:large subunit ribosomal protein L31
VKPEIHPEYHPIVFIDGDNQIITRSTMKSGETKVINGVEHQVVHVDISAYSHPFYTGKQRLVDTAGRVERFRNRYAKKA